MRCSAQPDGNHSLDDGALRTADRRDVVSGTPRLEGPGGIGSEDVLRAAEAAAPGGSQSRDSPALWRRAGRHGSCTGAGSSCCPASSCARSLEYASSTLLKQSCTRFRSLCEASCGIVELDCWPCPACCGPWLCLRPGGGSGFGPFVPDSAGVTGASNWATKCCSPICGLPSCPACGRLCSGPEDGTSWSCILPNAGVICSVWPACLGLCKTLGDGTAFRSSILPDGGVTGTGTSTATCDSRTVDCSSCPTRFGICTTSNDDIMCWPSTLPAHGVTGAGASAATCRSQTGDCSSRLNCFLLRTAPYDDTKSRSSNLPDGGVTGTGTSPKICLRAIGDRASCPSRSANKSLLPGELLGTP
mmetsp:Transcript_126977/g.283962  ORF Transcript_126977/g.283962 Transcript_126977/m.283962 type:complete len:359 (+) Transcript_126977:123-1199(+)